MPPASNGWSTGWPPRAGTAGESFGSSRPARSRLTSRAKEDALRRVWTLAEFAGAPDAVTGTRVGFVAFAGMTLLDLVGALDPISRIASMGFDPTATCEVVAAHDAAVWSGTGRPSPWRGTGPI